MTLQHKTSQGIRTIGEWRVIWQALGELRAISGLHTARIACAYDLDIEEQLEPILPPEYEKESSEPAAPADR